MLCAIFKGPYDFAIEERPLPVPAPGQAVVRIMAAGICGSDLPPYQGRDMVRRQPGIIMGHEAAGVVCAVGANVPDWRAGDRVAINPQIYCGTCPNCLSGRRNLCDRMLLIGSSKRKFLDGAMCQYMAISARQLVRLPAAVSYSAGALLDPAGNAFRVVRRAGVGLGQTVAVIGCGAIGLMVIQAARLSGARRVIAVNRSPERLPRAASLGADPVLCSGGERDAAADILAVTDGQGADVVIDAAGSAKTYELAVRSCRKQGTVIALGYTDPSIAFPMTDLIFKEIRLLGCTGFADEQPLVLDYLAQGLLRSEPVLTHHFPLTAVKKAFDCLLDPSSGAIKVMLHPHPEGEEN